MTGRLGVGFVGSGFNTRFHMQGFRGVRDADVLGVWSPNRGRAEDAAAYARSLLLGAIQAALQTLPPAQREVFVAHEIEGLSFADLSAQWRVPQNTLLARKRYAVLALRLRLQAEYGDLIV